MKTHSTPSALRLVAGALAEGFAKYNKSPPRPTVYYIGPDPLTPDAEYRRRRIRSLFERQDIELWWPSEWQSWSREVVERNGLDVPWMMHASVVASIRDADAIVANVSPFRGPHMYCATAFAIGMAVALSKPVFAWSSSSVSRPLDQGGRREWRLTTLMDRIWVNKRAKADGQWCDDNHNAVENFGLVNSAPIAIAIEPVHASVEAAAAACASHFKRQNAPGVAMERQQGSA